MNLNILIKTRNKYKNNIAIFLFLICLLFSLIQLINIKENFRLELEQEQAKLKSITYNEGNNNNNNVIGLSYTNKSIWSLVNLVFYLFIGGLIYGKIEWD